jgi:NADPH-dependent 2,4-dienoyl-CoA reductase/sulfur reductase-like enzyme
VAESAVDILLVGGGVAAARCARTLRRRGFPGSILLVGEEPHAPYNRPPLSKELLRDDLPLELVAAEPAEWYARHDVELTMGVAVTELDPGARGAELASGDRIRYDKCLLATGAEPRRPMVPGAEEHALLLRTLDDALRLRGEAEAGTRAVVIGGGFIGIEAAASMAARGVSVTVVELASTLWGGTLGEEVASWAIAALERVGVAIRTGETVTGIEGDGVWVGEERLPADLILAGVGVTPRQRLAESAGLAVGDGVLVDTDGRTSASSLWAAGDVARVEDRRVEHWHAAREQGERVALSMLGETLPPSRAPWVFSEFAGQMLDVMGHAPAWDATRTFGDAAGDRFVVAFLRGDRVIQLAVTNNALASDAARRLVEAEPKFADLEREVARIAGEHGDAWWAQ